MTEEILVVDESNNAVGLKDRKIVHEQGLYHRAVVILVTDSERRILLQRRAAGKDVCPLCWDLSAAEHLKPGENYEQAARRGLKEELGLANVNLVRIRGVHLQKNEYNCGKLKDYELLELYKVVFDGTMVIDKDEVKEVCFVPAGRVEEMARSGQLTPWFLDEWQWLKGNAAAGIL